MAQGPSRRRAIWAVLGLAVVLALAITLTRSCKGGQRLAGQAKGSVESMEQVPREVVLGLPGLEESLSSTKPPMTLSKYVYLGCALIIDDDAQHLVYTEDPNCPSVVLADAAGFDLVISYTDASCRWEPTFVVGRTGKLLHFTIDKSRDRGGCDDTMLLLAKGIRIKEQAGIK